MSTTSRERCSAQGNGGAEGFAPPLPSKSDLGLALGAIEDRAYSPGAQATMPAALARSLSPEPHASCASDTSSIPDSDGEMSTTSSDGGLPSVEDLVRRRQRRRSSASQSRVSVENATSSARSSVPRGPSSVIQQTPKVLVLDLDETLIHSKLRPAPLWGLLGATSYASPRADRRAIQRSSGLLGFLGLGPGGATSARLQVTVIEVKIEGRSVFYQVYKRPWVDYFLRKVAQWYQVVVFTASMQEYADPVIDWLDGGQGLISRRLFRASCTLRNGTYLKDLARVEEDLRRVCLVDNSPISYVLQEANGIPIDGWTQDPNDEALLDLLPVLDGLRYASDVRHILGLRGFL